MKMAGKGVNGKGFRAVSSSSESAKKLTTHWSECRSGIVAAKWLHARHCFPLSAFPYRDNYN